MLRRSSWMLVVAVLALGCLAGSHQTAEAATGSPQAQPLASASAPVRARAVRLAFLDRARACRCSQAKIDAGWAVVQAVLGSGSRIPVDRIHMDTQSDKAAPYLEKRRLVAIPGLYVLDGGGNVLELFQGDIDEKALRKALR